MAIQMDGIKRNHNPGLMPPPAPLQMPVQNLRAHFGDADAPGWRRTRARLWKYATFPPAILTTTLLLSAFTDWLATGGLGWLEYLLITLVGITFFWISLSVSTATLGLLGLWLRKKRGVIHAPVTPLNVALLVPVYNENPSDVFGNAAAMLTELKTQDAAHAFSLFILSDTRDEVIAEEELRAFAQLRASLPVGCEIYYRRRETNADRKTGNLADWVEGWGGGYDAMLVLDADSLMSGEAIIALADELSRDPSAGLIQSAPELIGAETLFARLQQFSGTTYGGPLATGLAMWSNRESNYWGHNAIIRTRAFASCAGLPRLRGLLGKDRLIMSHDYVEAGLLRRAGWAVRFLPAIKGSFEETPPTLVDYALRDRRWCQGNLQHLRILGARGLHPVSRFHMLHGAISYLLSPAWFLLLLIWALLANGEGKNVIAYFSAANPTMPIWPHMSTVNSILILLFMYAMLLAPKVMGALTVWFQPQVRADYGGQRQFAISFVAEVICSVLYAPIMMVQQTVAVLRTAVGLREQWTPQRREAGSYPLMTLVKFHLLETLCGTALMAGIIGGLVSLWLLPIAISLCFAVPLSALSGLNFSARNWPHLGTPIEFAAPQIITLAKHRRAELRKALNKAPEAAE
ncbi:glucans biosynthesis glucosyltransferase MdoH [Thalassobius sp. I31.1]|uniref:glucans biosynthesis glucosyltransferase MdoH n=1 Tax=Thalassobius sp. I31.1 TaxID=2109912 RepID=UPI001E2E91CA|nr:glucans biosynthesis glucosyltransferase MdoH [Thalassobius sp. I31.1]